MTFDIIITGDSLNCYNSLLNINYNKNLLSIFICAKKINYNTNVGLFSKVCIEAKSINKVIKKCTSKFVIVFNSKAIVNKECLNALCSSILQNSNYIAFDFAKQNEEYAHFVSPDTFCTKIIHTSGFAALRESLVNCDIKINILPFKYADIDLSLQLTNKGSMLYCPGVKYEYSNEISDKQMYIDENLGELLLSYMYATPQQIIAKNKQYINTVKSPKHFDGIVKKLAKEYVKHFVYVCALLVSKKRRKHINVHDFNFEMYDIRGTYKTLPIKENPLVSVIVRTYRRKESLRKTLKSLSAQTYKNFEVIVVEDGQDLSSDVTNSFKNVMNITHNATNTPIGRGAVANTGLGLAKGEYMCFLDDDDFYYPDYIYTCVSFLTNNKNANLVFTSTLAADINIVSQQPYKFEIEKVTPVIFDHITLMDMCVKCRVPITAGMFKKELFLKCGGMRQDIDADEDWAMWLKFLKVANRANKYEPDIKRALSLCVYPADETQAQNRMKNYEKFDKIMLSDESLVFDVDIEELIEFEKYVKADTLHLFNLGLLKKYVDEHKPISTKMPNINNNGKTTLTALQINAYRNNLFLNYASELLKQP